MEFLSLEGSLQLGQTLRWDGLIEDKGLSNPIPAFSKGLDYMTLSSLLSPFSYDCMANFQIFKQRP